MRAILTYHSVDPSGSVISVAPATFERHLAHLKTAGIPVVPLTRLPDLPDDASAVALTFDDGFENFATAAWPRLADAGCPATVFVVSGRTGATNDWSGSPEPGIPSLPLMDWDAVARVAEAGASIAGHGRTHVRLPGLHREQLEEEVASCVEEIQARTGIRPDAFAYPYGAVDDRGAQAVARHFRLACTTELRLLGPEEDPVRLPRLDAFYFRRPGPFERYGTQSFRRFVARRALLRRLRSALVGRRSRGRNRATADEPSASMLEEKE